MKIKLLSLDNILEINQEVCATVKQKSVCMDSGKVESALGAAFIIEKTASSHMNKDDLIIWFDRHKCSHF